MKTKLIATCFMLIVCALIAINGQPIERRSPMLKRASMLRLGKRLNDMNEVDGAKLRLLQRPLNGLPFKFQNVRFRNENGDLWDESVVNSKEELKQAWREFLDKLYSESNESSQEQTAVY